MREILLSSRPISWVNTAYPFAAAFLVAGGSFGPLLIVGTFFFLFPYNLLMYGINDVFDYESDKNNPRKGGVEGALLEKSSHRLVLWSCILIPLPFILWLLLNGSLLSNIVLAALLFFVVAYSAPKLRFKERPFLDSITSSIHFVGPMIYGLTVTSWPDKAWYFVVAFFFWGMASHAFGAVQDIKADRLGGLGSIGTSLGAKNTVRFSAVFYLAAAILVALTGWQGLLVGITGLLYVLNVWPYINLRDKDCEKANPAWRRFIYINWITGAVITMVLIAAFTSQ